MKKQKQKQSLLKKVKANHDGTTRVHSSAWKVEAYTQKADLTINISIANYVTGHIHLKVLFIHINTHDVVGMATRGQ